MDFNQKDYSLITRVLALFKAALFLTGARDL